MTAEEMSRAEALARAARTLCHGGVVVVPTDTVYGIAAHPAHADAVARLGALKGRAQEKPIALLAADLEAVVEFGACLTPRARALAAAFWPGALTLVVPCGGRLEGFRVPAHALLRSLLAACGGVLRVTSANLSGAMPAVCAAEALKDVGLAVDMVLDGGVSPGRVASSVVRCDSSGGLEILREGALSGALLRRMADPPDGAVGLAVDLP